ncbi:TonB-dependent receptor [Sphingomonas sp. ASY06-1R]|uniref:TonB-dependent receptor n=1 Tax=Sphingomonas sp. ASY06-1R TaxID=3445771 RepID=UPI003FA2B9D5
MPHVSLLRATSALASSLAPLTIALLFAAPAAAQDSATPDAAPAASTAAAVPATPETTGTGAEASDEIVVTGSRIERPDLTSSSPVSTVGAAALKINNSVTVEQILNANPQFVPSANAASNNPSDGVATVDLRGLGSQRTLVLIDGKRAPSYNSKGSVDVNTIPTALIKRVDVLTGGASAVYGSDAIAGVVNFILDDRFTGLRADGSSQISTYGDGAQYDGSLTGGVKLGDRGNIVVSAGYSKREGVKFGDRPRNSTATSSKDLTSSAGSSNANPTVFDLANGDQLQVNDSGALVPIYHLYNFSPVNYAQTPFERYNVMALARYELTDNIEAFGRANYVHSKVRATLAPTATAGYTFDISPDNPFLTDGERATFFAPGTALNPDGTSTIGIRRRMTETGGRVQNFVTKNYQVMGGLRGDVSGFNWEVFGQYGKTKRHQDLLNDLSYNALSQAIDAVAGPNGPACRDPSNGCVPIDVFTTGTISANQLAFVERNGAVDDTSSQLVFGADINGDVNFLKSPFADLPAAVSLGVEYRRERAKSVADANYASGDLIYYGQGQSIAGSYNTKEAYIELKMPLVTDKPFIKALNFEGGFRYSDYSTVGSVYTYKAGGDWSPVEGVRFRGIYQRAVRAPNIYELFSPVVGGTGSLSNDPCAGGNVPAAIANICIAQGAPGVGNIPQPVSGQINVFTGGNPNLRAEKSDTYTLGVVINPVRLRALTISVDYFNINIANAIDVTPPQIIIDQCFNQSQDPSSAVCQSIKRNPLNGSLSGNLQYGVPQQLGNIASKKTDGIDVAVGYNGGTSDRFHYNLSFAGTYTINYKQTADPTSGAIQCAGRFGSACNIEPISKWKHTATVSLGFAGIDLQTRWRYLSAIKQDVGTDILKSRIPAYSYFDETASIDVNKVFTLRLGVQNLFNKKSPIVGDTVGNDYNAGSTFPVTYDVIGRTLFAGFTAKF